MTMRKRVPICLCLVGWEDSKMTKPVRCSKRATHRLMPYDVSACRDHVRANEEKSLTYAPTAQPMIGAGKGSHYEPL